MGRKELQSGCTFSINCYELECLSFLIDTTWLSVIWKIHKRYYREWRSRMYFKIQIIVYLILILSLAIF